VERSRVDALATHWCWENSYDKRGGFVSESKVLDAACRVALAGLLHDLGKFAERARLREAEEKNADGNSRRDVNVQLYCPHFDGRPSHIHAAYTAIGFDILEQHFPELVGQDMHPFAPWKDKDADDSIINAAAKHHRPETFLQWVIATADRVASGFERETFDPYNRSQDKTESGKSHYTARQLTLLEQIRINEHPEVGSLSWRYPLKPLSPSAIFPVEAQGYEGDDNASGQREYRELWQTFIKSLDAIPDSHRGSLPLWLDHMDSLWACYAHAIPSATAFGVRPDVSLYDHAKAVAALAVALWRYHHDRGDSTEDTRDAMRGYRDWTDDKLLLIQGDLFGIQDFIFSTGGETQRRAAKLLRGRSFYVGLLTECAALKVLDALDLPPTSQIVNAAGKFLIVAHNTEDARERLKGVRAELDEWFLAHTCGQVGVGIAWQSASCDDFRQGSHQGSPFRSLMKRLFTQLEDAKLQRFGLCGDVPPEPVFEEFLTRFEHGPCAIDGKMPADQQMPGSDAWISHLSMDQISIGGALVAKERLLVTREPLEGRSVKALEIPIFGYSVAFTGAEEASGHFGREAQSGNLVRAWDFSLPESEDGPLFSGYARRYINAYVPRFSMPNAWDDDRYSRCAAEEDVEREVNAVKTFGHLACDARQLDEKGNWIGVPALMTLKGDVDNLGLIFQDGLDAPSFARMAALSRQMHAFFAIYLPWLCRESFPNSYTVFAGGDDFFLIGPWREQIKLVRRLRDEFRRYVACNPEVHFSAGLVMTKPGLPVRYLANAAETSLEEAKEHGRGEGLHPTKNAVTCFGETVGWEDFVRLLGDSDTLGDLAYRFGLSTSYLYGLLGLVEMAENLAGAEGVRPENARWRSYFWYRTYRMLERKGIPKDRRSRILTEELAPIIAEQGIGRFAGRYRIALFNHLYQHRD
jgi:CRISPR-associated protein Csm1